MELSKKYDTFIFFNELDLLEIRLNILNEFVDYFVLVEATHTFTGNKKPLYYNENKNKFKDFNDKIIHIIVDDLPNSFEELSNRSGDELDKSIWYDCLTTPNVPKGEVHWLREFYQKEQIKKALINLKENDFVFISDLDEIWDPNISINLDSNDIFRLNQKVYTYYLNNRSSENWYGTIGTKYKNIKNYSINHIRTPNRNNYSIVNNAGWHFTFQGGSENIKNKIESYGHQELNTESIKSLINTRINQNTDVFGRPHNLWVEYEFLPKYILNNKEKFNHMLK
jgi:beta-1,4-mannosyl-glycoprotein beta-1,4-N-acetylglucosaminyltransferase